MNILNRLAKYFCDGAVANQKFLPKFKENPLSSSGMYKKALSSAKSGLTTASLQKFTEDKYFEKLGKKIALWLNIWSKSKRAFTCFVLLFTLIALNKVNPTFAQEIFIVAKANSQVITNLDLVDRYRFLMLTSKIRDSSSQEKLMLLNQLLQKMIDEKLQAEEAKQLGIDSNSKEIQEALEKIAEDQGKTVSSLRNFIISNRLSYENYIKQIESQVLWNKLILKVLPAKIKISNFDIDEVVELNKINANITQFFLAEIYIPFDYKISSDKIDAKDLALKLVNELKDGRNFKNLVKQFSRSPTAEFNGEIGWVGKNDVASKIYEQISKLKTNEISNPIMMDSGYYIFKVLKKRVASNLKEDDVKQIRNVIFSKKLQMAAKSYLIDIRRKSYVEIDYQKLPLVLNNP